MQLGNFTVELLSEGRFELFADGHINRSPKEPGEPPGGSSTSGDGAVKVGINPILVRTAQYNILLDTGLGWGLDAGSSYTDVSNIRTNLEIFELEPDEISHVILSHLHYDHAAGSSFSNSVSEVQATFPNATYYLQQSEWEYALRQLESEDAYFGAGYELDDFYRLVADGQVSFLQDRRNEIVEGVTAVKTGGHTPGHQIVELESEGKKAYYLGDLLPTAFHLNHYAMNSADVNSVEAKKQKVQLLKRACEEKALLLFYHSRYGQSGRLIRDEDKQYVLADLPENS